MNITFKRPDGKECSGYLAEPSDQTAPGVVVIQEWWGVTDQIRGVAARLAELGYRALVPDLYRGEMTLDAKEAEHLMGKLDFMDAASQDIRGAVLHLKQSSPKVGIMGFCMGGALAILSATQAPEADVIVCYYGCPPLEYFDATKIKVPFLGHFAIRDAFFPITQIDGLEQKFQAANVTFEFHRYDCLHAFANETLENPPIPAKYDPSAASAAWQRTQDFLKKTLG